MNKVNKLTLASPDYPEVLRHIPDAPKQLYVQGSLDTLGEARTRLAVVGSRKATAYGRSVTETLVSQVAHGNFAVVSGLAFGIDAIAHKAALESNMKTIAVMPAGLDTIYPSAHKKLARQILDQGGTLVSEYESGTPALRQHFVQRNRIVSGLSDAVLITEAAQKSGTLHTARFALEQGRAVLAVPGNINSQMSQGTNNLIAQGARPALKAEDIIEELGLMDVAETEQQHLILGDTEAESIIIGLLEAGYSDGKDLLEKSNLSTSEYNQTITMLEISGKIRPLGADHWRLQK